MITNNVSTSKNNMIYHLTLNNRNWLKITYFTNLNKKHLNILLIIILKNQLQSNQASVVLAKEQTKRSKEQKREPRNRPIQI